MIDNPRLKDKFVFIMGTSVNFIKHYLTTHGIQYFSTHALFYNKESIKVWMNSIGQFMNLLKEELKEHKQH